MSYKSRDQELGAKERSAEWHITVVPVSNSAKFVKFRRYDFHYFRDGKTHLQACSSQNQIAVGAGADFLYKSQKDDMMYSSNFELLVTRYRKVLELSHNDGEDDATPDGVLYRTDFFI